MKREVIVMDTGLAIALFVPVDNTSFVNVNKTLGAGCLYCKYSS